MSYDDLRTVTQAQIDLVADFGEYWHKRYTQLRDDVILLRESHDEDTVLVPVFLAMLEKVYESAGIEKRSV